MKKQKIIIGFLSMFLSFGAFAQDETDDMYFFESDIKTSAKKELASQPLGNDQPSSISKFSNPDFAGGQEVDDNYTVTYNYYDNNFSNFNNGFQPGFAARSGWARGGFYNSSIYSQWGYSAIDCPPTGTLGSSFGWGWNRGVSRNTAFWDCPPFGRNSGVIVSVGSSWNAARFNTPFRNFNSWNNWSYNNVYCPPSAYGNSVATQARNSQNAVRAVRSNRSARNYASTTRSPRTYATRSIADNSRRSVSRSGRSVTGNRTTNSRFGSGYSSSSRSSSSYSRTRSNYGRSSSSSSSRSRSSYSSGRSSSSRSSSFSSGRSSSSSRGSSVRSSSGSRSSGSRSSSSRSSGGTRRR